MGHVFARLHRDHGVELLTDTVVREVRGSGGRATTVVTDGHAGLPADVVVVGIGVVPDTGLAASAGLDVDNGIVTDHALRTSAADVHAAGDVAAAFHPLYGRHVRVEHWANALHQGPAAARSMLGQEVVFDRVPYFFTDQYEDRKSTRLNSSHANISYAVFCLKKKKNKYLQSVRSHNAITI